MSTRTSFKPVTAAASIDIQSTFSPWTSSGNALADDNAYATCVVDPTGADKSDFLRGTFPAFSTVEIPPGSTGLTPVARLRAKTSGTVAQINAIYVNSASGAIAGSSGTAGQALTTSEVAYDFASAFGQSFTESQARAGGLFVFVQMLGTGVNARTVSVDDIEIAWDYTPPAGNASGCMV